MIDIIHHISESLPQPMITIIVTEKRSFVVVVAHIYAMMKQKGDDENKMFARKSNDGHFITSILSGRMLSNGKQQKMCGMF